MIGNGFVKFPRELAGRSWFTDGTTLKLYVFLLCEAAFTDIEREGYIIRKGQYVTSNRKLSEKCRLGIQQVRSALDRLKATRDITVEPSTKFSIITVTAAADADRADPPANPRADPQDNPQSNPISRSKEVKEEIKEIKEVRTASPLAHTFENNDISSGEECGDERRALIEEYGVSAVLTYENRFRRWAAGKKTVNAAMYPTIAKWMAQDIRVRGGSPAKNECQNSSIDVDEFENAVMQQYMKKS